MADLDVNKKKPHVAIFNCAQHGHVNPTLATVRELVARGYRVSYVTSSVFAQSVEFAGATPVLFSSSINKGKPLSENLVYSFTEFAKEAAAHYPGMMAAFSGDLPDIIAYDFFGWHGKALAHLWGIPSILLSPTHVNYEGMFEEWHGIPIEEHPGLPIIEKMLHDNELQLNAETFMSSHENVIAYLPHSFQEKLSTTDPSTTFVGPDIEGRSPHTGWMPTEMDKPIVLISLGTLFNHQPEFFNSCIKAFSDTEWHVVLVIGQHIDPESFGNIPPNIEIHRYIPQLEVLQMASLFITHAGMGSIMESVHYGVPMIAVPQMAEQRTNAKRLQMLNLGKYLPREDVTATNLLSCAREVKANPNYLRGISLLQKDIKNAGGSKAAANVFDRIMGMKGSR